MAQLWFNRWSRAAASPGHGELSPEVTGHQLAREHDIAGGFLTLVFPLLPIPARVALKLLSVGGTPAGTERAAGFLSPWALPTLPDAGRALSSRQLRRAGSFAVGCRQREKDGEKEERLHVEGFGCHPSACSRLVRSRAAA